MLMHALCTIFFRSNLCCQLWFTTQLINKRRTCQMEVKIREIFQFFHSKMCIVIVIFPIFKDPKTRNWIEKLFCKALPFVNSKDTILANLFNLTERIFFSFLWSFTWFLRHFLKLRCHQFKVINGRFLALSPNNFITHSTRKNTVARKNSVCVKFKIDYM